MYLMPCPILCFADEMSGLAEAGAPRAAHHRQVLEAVQERERERVEAACEYARERQEELADHIATSSR